MSKENKQVIHKAIAANLDALSQRLSQAALLAKEAHEAMEAGEQNQAIGTVLEFERLLPEAQALFRAALVLHRNHP
ncbi:MAG: hypothetical protein KGJ13_07830 [Patescibacteria group bacterium]|nr:hypothetical protein [Patescibacteria group bacterium]